MTAPLSLPIHVRAYVPDGSKPKSGRNHAPQASQWSIVFDCETTVDAAQQLRFGTYQLRKGGTIREQGYFYDENALSREEMAILRATAAKQNVKAISKDAFVETVLYRMGYELRALIIGFNLPFDISRLAIGHGRAKRGMTGGFTFQLSQNPNLARIQIRHLSRRAAFIQFAGIGRQRLSRSERKRGVSRESRRGHFVDLNTLASALFSKSFNLASLCDHLSTKTQKLSTGEHGQKLTPEYLRYAMTDTQATWECYVELARHFEENFGLKDLALESIYSEASLGKAFLKAMNIKPWRVCQPDFPDEITGQILSAYYGGRSEVRIRRDIRQVLYCDFLSMYPTVCTLMGLWRFVIADGVTWRDATDETRALLASIGPDDLQSPDFWKCLRVLVQVKPDGDLFPVRAAYGDGPQATIGLNRLTSAAPLWFTLADCIVSTLLSGKPPTILRAIEFLPGEPQTGLRSVTLPGGARIDPEKEDFYRAIIDRRQEIKAQLKAVAGTRRGELDIAQNSLKIIANATSYGSFVEINVQECARERDALCHGQADAAFSLRVTKDEQPGVYFHPLLATLITGAAQDVHSFL